MSEHTDPAGEAAEVLDRARAAENAIQQLCRATLTRPSMTPAEVDVVLAHLAAAAAALPQVASQLGDILEQSKHDHVLEMDAMTETEDPDLAIDTARLHLGEISKHAIGLYRLLDAAHQETAHIAVTDQRANQQEYLPQAFTSVAPRPEERQPPPMGSGPGLPR